MKIAIFGDSFADRCPENTTLTWVDHLMKKYDVDNFAGAGSNLYYSARQFHKHHSNYEKIIFVFTQPGRLFLPEHSCFDSIAQRRIPSHMPAKRYIEEFNEKLAQADLSDVQRTRHKQKILIWQAAIDYYKYLSDFEYDRYIHQLMIDDIVKTRPDSVLIPSFPESFDDSNDVMSMFDIQEKENKAWGIHSLFVHKSDIRNCHMTAENNEIFASKVEEWINGASVNIDLDDFVEPSMESRKFYISELE